MEEASGTAAGEVLLDSEGHASEGCPLVVGSGHEIEYSGWIYHLGINSIGHEFCHLRFLVLKGTFVAMYKRDPHEHHDSKPIRKGAVSHTLVVEELVRRNISDGIACANVGEAHKWMEAFEQAKQLIDVDIGSSSVARSIISLVIGYITSIVVDLAILIEAKEEYELPEYILGTVRLNRVGLESAVPYWNS